MKYIVDSQEALNRHLGTMLFTGVLNSYWDSPKHCLRSGLPQLLKTDWAHIFSLHEKSDLYLRDNQIYPIILERCLPTVLPLFEWTEDQKKDPLMSPIMPMSMHSARIAFMGETIPELGRTPAQIAKKVFPCVTLNSGYTLTGSLPALIEAWEGLRPVAGDFVLSAREVISAVRKLPCSEQALRCLIASNL